MLIRKISYSYWVITITYNPVKPYIKEIYRLINLSYCHTVGRTISGYNPRKNSYKNENPLGYKQVIAQVHSYDICY